MLPFIFYFCTKLTAGGGCGSSSGVSGGGTGAMALHTNFEPHIPDQK
jgi:hypothetical protein